MARMACPRESSWLRHCARCECRRKLLQLAGRVSRSRLCCVGPPGRPRLASPRGGAKPFCVQRAHGGGTRPAANQVHERIVTNWKQTRFSRIARGSSRSLTRLRPAASGSSKATQCRRCHDAAHVDWS
ncbi:Hypothetical predicted protein [Olea europaea subsp. europaea]|uniref:Uncharacterized protein n=1 Tax=Olea europaea subsp. europaea TaxID=158383 RepID=A0A8S0TKR2_OLEEU|nr:Hypothetical predicted protein [Olea europaea subsp. europaea]